MTTDKAAYSVLCGADYEAYGTYSCTKEQGHAGPHGYKGEHDEVFHHAMLMGEPEDRAWEFVERWQFAYRQHPVYKSLPHAYARFQQERSLPPKSREL